MVCQIRILADWAFKKTFPLVISKCPQNDTTQNIASPNVAKCLQRFLVQLDEIAMTCYFHPFSEKYLTIFFFQVAFLSRSNCIHKQQSQFALFHARAYLLLLLLAFVCGWVCDGKSKRGCGGWGWTGGGQSWGRFCGDDVATNGPSRLWLKEAPSVLRIPESW